MGFDLRAYKVADFLEFIVAVVSISSGSLGIIAFFKGNLAQNNTYLIVAAGTAAISALSIIFFIKLVKIQRIARNRLRLFSESFHKLTDLVRNEFYRLSKLHQQDRLTNECLLETLSNTTQQSVNWLSDCLTASTGRVVCSTIKYFDTGEDKNTVLHPGMKVKTLCRSSNQSRERSEKDGELSEIEKNTDFLDIIKESKSYFAAGDLKKYSKIRKVSTGTPVINSNANWSDHYVATIVVPIRIKRKYIDQQYNGDGFHNVGFLCVDSKSTSAFRDNDMKSYINLVQSFADCLYKYFDRFLYYQKAIQEASCSTES